METRAILRSHPFRIFVPAAALLVLGSPALVLFGFEEARALSVQMGISTELLLATLIGLLSGSLSLSRDRERGVTDLLAARSLPPAKLIAGKWAGIVAAIALSVASLGAVHMLATAARGGPPAGYGPIAAALAVAVAQGGLAAAAALAFAARLRAGAAFAAGLLLLLAGHTAGLLGDSTAAEAARFLLPRANLLNLSAEAAFGPFAPGLFLLSALHGTCYAVALLAIAVALLARRR